MQNNSAPGFRGYLVYDGDARNVMSEQEYDSALSVFTSTLSLVYVKREIAPDRGMRIVSGYVGGEDVRRWAVTDDGVYDGAGRLTPYDPAMFDRRYRIAEVRSAGDPLRVGGLIEVGEGRRYVSEKYQWASADERYVIDGVFATQYRLRFGVYGGSPLVWCLGDSWYDGVHAGDGCVLFTGPYRIFGIRGCDFGLYDAGPLPGCFDEVAWSNAFTGTLWGEGVEGGYVACGVGVTELKRPTAIEAGRLLSGTVTVTDGKRHTLMRYAVVGDDVVTAGGKVFRGMARYVDPTRRLYRDWGDKVWRYGMNVWGAFRYQRHVLGETWKTKLVTGHAYIDYANKMHIEGEVRAVAIAGHAYDRIYGCGAAHTILAGPRSVGVITYPKRFTVAPFALESKN